MDRVREICFGSSPGGLPDTFGWIGLILGPASTLAALIVIWSPQFRFSLSGTLRRLVGAGLAGVMLAGIAWTGERIHRAWKVMPPLPGSHVSVDGMPSSYPRVDRPAPDFSLIDEAGRTWSLADCRGRPTLLTFAFAHCETTCPTIVKNAIAAVESARPLRPILLIVTLDPSRDTPPSLPSIAREWGLREDMHVLSGTPAEVESVLDTFNVRRRRDNSTGEVEHPSLAYVLGPDGRLVYELRVLSRSWFEQAIERVGGGGKSARSRDRESARKAQRPG
ncbi:MAG: SCO family protein [Nitrospirae bacterium]|nr:SCO family protein [Nitrospirota bacterium]